MSVSKKIRKLEEARPKDKKSGKSLAKAAGEASSREKLAPPPKRRKETSEQPSGALVDDSDEEFLSERGPTGSVEPFDISAAVLSLVQRMGDLEEYVKKAAESGAPSKSMWLKVNAECEIKRVT